MSHNRDQLTVEWGVQYEIDSQPSMDGTTVEKVTQVLDSQDHAQNCVDRGLPMGMGARNHRVVRRYVTQWEEIDHEQS